MPFSLIKKVKSIIPSLDLRTAKNDYQSPSYRRAKKVRSYLAEGVLSLFALSLNLVGGINCCLTEGPASSALSLLFALSVRSSAGTTAGRILS